jgi:hypothetical protein
MTRVGQSATIVAGVSGVLVGTIVGVEKKSPMCAKRCLLE